MIKTATSVPSKTLIVIPALVLALLLTTQTAFAQNATPSTDYEMGWNAGHNDWSNNYHGHCGSHRSSEFCRGYYNGVNGYAYFSQGNTQQTQ